MFRELFPVVLVGLGEVVESVVLGFLWLGLVAGRWVWLVRLGFLLWRLALLAEVSQTLVSSRTGARIEVLVIVSMSMPLGFRFVG